MEPDATQPAGGDETEPARPGEAPPAPASYGGTPPGELFDGRYRVVQTLGKGGFGKVYLVEDELHRGERLALKVILPKHQETQEFEIRFRNEIRVLRSMQHAGIPQIFNDGKTAAGELYYTMELVAGRTLESILEESKRLDPPRIAELVRQMVHILEYAHSRGVIHRDLKPGNIVLSDPGTERERVHILDFGIAKILRREGLLEMAMTMDTGTPLGTPHYMAPEQVQGDEVDGRTDFYALGIILYRMVSGSYPFSGKTIPEILLARVQKRPAPLVRDTAPPAIEELIERLLQRRKEKRPTGEQILDLLRQVIDTQRRHGRQLRRLAAAVGLVAGLTLLGLWRPWNLLRSGVAGEGEAELVDPALGDRGAVASGAPVVTLQEPAEGLLSRTAEVLVKGTVQPANLGRIHVHDDFVVVRPEGRFERLLTLPPGETLLRISTDADGPLLATRTILVDPLPPRIELETGILLQRAGWTTETQGETVYLDDGGSDGLVLSWTVIDDGPGPLVRFQVNGEEVAWTPEGKAAYSFDPAEDGLLRLSAVAADRAGNETLLFCFVARDRAAPIVRCNPPTRTPTGAWALSGRVSDLTPVELWLDGLPLELSAEGMFASEVSLSPGSHRLSLRARDALGHESELPVPVTVPRPAPQLATSSLDSLPSELPAHAATLKVQGTADQPLDRAEVNGVAAQVDGARFEREVPLAYGENRLELVLWNLEGTEARLPAHAVTRAWPAPPQGCQPAPDATVGPEGFWSAVRHEATGLELLLVPALREGERPFYLSRHEVTCQVYQSSCKRGRREQPAEAGVGIRGDHPVVNVSADAAMAFCADEGLRLPQVGEWRRAVQGSSAARYPWGEDWRPRSCNAAGDEDGFSGAAPVGSLPEDRSWCGIFDLAGNVSEWVLASDEPTLRGGSFRSDAKACAADFEPLIVPRQNEMLGFRVALDVP